MMETTKRPYAQNLLGALALSLSDRLTAATIAVAGFGPSSPAALVTLLWYPGRSTDALARILGLTHPGTVVLIDRMVAAGLVERSVGDDRRVRLLELTRAGRRRARMVLEARQTMLAEAMQAVEPAAQEIVTGALESMLSALTADRTTADRICRLCDEHGCPDASCPVENAPALAAGRR